MREFLAFSSNTFEGHFGGAIHSTSNITLVDFLNTKTTTT